MYKKVTPTHFYKTIKDVDYQQLKEQGIKALFFDLDNTLIPYDVYEVSGEYKALLEILNKDFKVVVISNSRQKRVYKAVKSLEGIPFIHFGLKPLKFGFKKALKLTGVEKEEVAVFGDQMMTDIFGASRMEFKVKTLIYPIKKRSDHIFTRFNRRIEKYFIDKIKRKTPEKYEKVLKEYVETK